MVVLFAVRFNRIKKLGSQAVVYPRVQHAISTSTIGDWLRRERNEKKKSTTNKKYKSRNSIGTKQQRDDLERLVEQSVRDYLVRTYPEAFSIHRPKKEGKQETVEPRRIQSIADFQFRLRQNQENNDNLKKKMKQPIISYALQTLLGLNGFDRVATPEGDTSLRLAEGVLAQPSFYGSSLPPFDGGRNFALFSQTMDQYSQPQIDKKKILPKLVAEDIKIYRRLEKQVDQFLEVRYNELKYNYNLLKTKYHEAEQWINAKYYETEQWINTNVIRRTPDVCPLQHEKKQQEDSPPLPIVLCKNVNSLENLLVVGDDGDDNLLLVSYMEPTRRLLVLPHGLKLNTASTLISVSLVIFGALPLAYRSINFAVEYYSYPLMSEAMSLSVAGTVGYGIWSSRDASRTRQAHTVANSISHRIYARDEAVFWVLQEGAVRRLAKAVLALYFHHYYNSNNIAADRDSLALPQTTSNPFEIAIELGLIEKESGGGYKSADIAKACVSLKSIDR